MATAGVARSTHVEADAVVPEAGTVDAGPAPHLDVCDARPGGPAERTAARLPLRRVPGRVRPVAAAFVVAAAGFVVLAALVVGWGLLLRDELLPGALQRWDAGNIRFLSDGRPEWNDWAAFGTAVADAPTVIIGAALVVGLACWRRWWAAAGVILVAVPLEGLLYLTGSGLVPRQRPSVPRFEDLPADTSYPSGHTAAALCLYAGIAIVVWNTTRNRALRAVALVVAVGAPVVVAISRMYRGMHFATDVMSGYAIGLGCLTVAVFAMRVAGIVAKRREEQAAA